MTVVVVVVVVVLIVLIVVVCNILHVTIPWLSVRIGGIMKLALLAIHSSSSPPSPSSAANAEDFDVTNLGFSPTVFYFGFLPPIIFCSGYHLKRRLFFHNFASILLMAVVGTVISVAMLAAGIFFMSRSPVFQGSAGGFHLSVMECVAFAALLSSTDPVRSMYVCVYVCIVCMCFVVITYRIGTYTLLIIHIYEHTYLHVH